MYYSDSENKNKSNEEIVEELLKKDKKKKEEESFFLKEDNEIILTILAWLVTDEELIAEYHELFKPLYFQDVLQRRLCKSLFDYYGQYRKLPIKVVLLNEATKGLNDEEALLIKVLYSTIEQYKLDATGERDYVEAKIVEHIKICEVRKAFKTCFKDAVNPATRAKALNELPDAINKMSDLGSRAYPIIEDAFDFCAEELNVPVELVQSVLHRGSKMGLGGGSKSYKTWVLICLALAVAYGKNWLGFKCNRGKVLFVNLEIQRPFSQRRLNAIAKKLGIVQEKGIIDIWNLRGYCATYHQFLPRLTAYAKNKGYDLIIIDPIYKLYGEKDDENGARDIKNLLNGLEQVSSALNDCAIAYGSHFAKGNASAKSPIDRVSGSGVFARDPDTLVNLTPHAEKDCFTVDSILRNFPPIDPFVVKWDYPIFEPCQELDPADLKNIGGRPPQYKDNDYWTGYTEPVTLPQWLDKLKSLGVNASKSSFYRWISQQINCGLLRQLPRVNGETSGRYEIIA